VQPRRDHGQPVDRLVAVLVAPHRCTASGTGAGAVV
jgi:hypothetical protein